MGAKQFESKTAQNTRCLGCRPIHRLGEETIAQLDIRCGLELYRGYADPRAQTNNWRVSARVLQPICAAVEGYLRPNKTSQTNQNDAVQSGNASVHIAESKIRFFVWTFLKAFVLVL